MIITFYEGTTEHVINNDKIVGLSAECKMYDEAFKLGSTPCMCLTLEILKGEISSAWNVTDVYVNDYDDSRFRHHFIIDEVNTDDDVVEKYTLVDYMIKFNFNYDGSSFIGTEGKTLLQVLQNICSVAGVTCYVSEFNGSDKLVTWYDNTISARDYISMISELAGGWAYIDYQGRLVFGEYTNDNITTSLALENTSGYKIGEYHKITRVLFDNTDLVLEAGNETYNTLYLNPNNVYITEQDDVDGIYNIIKNFDFYSMEIEKCPITKFVTPGWKINVSLDGTAQYTMLAQVQYSYMLGWQGGYSAMLANQEQEETQVVDTNTKIRTIKVIMDRQNGVFTREIGTVSANADAALDKANDVGSDLSNLSSSLDKQLAAIGTRIEQTESDISLKASSTYVDQQINDANDRIDDAEDEIEKTNKYITNTVELRISDLEAAIEAIQNGIGKAFVVTTDGAKVFAITDNERDETTYTLTDEFGNHFYVDSTQWGWATSNGFGTIKLTIGQTYNTSATAMWQIYTDSDNRLIFSWHS